MSEDHDGSESFEGWDELGPADVLREECGHEEASSLSCFICDGPTHALQNESRELQSDDFAVLDEWGGEDLHGVAAKLLEAQSFGGLGPATHGA